MAVTSYRLGGLVLTLMLSLAGTARSQELSPSAQATMLVYEDDDSTTVVTSDFTGKIDIGDKGDVLSVGYLVDAVSSASVDVVSAATGRWSEIRDELRLSGTKGINNQRWTASYRGSWENDFRSYAMSVKGSINTNQHNQTWTVGMGVVRSIVGRQGDPIFSKAQNAYIANIGLVQVINRKTIAAVGYHGSIVRGFQSSPYRFVTVGGNSMSEKTPELRHRHALSGTIRRSLTPQLAMGIEQRLYMGSWGLFASTTKVDLRLGLGEHIDVEIHNRFHYQGSASFYQRQYMTAYRFMTSDRELSSLANNHVGTQVEMRFTNLGPAETVRVYGGADFFVYRYFNSARIERRMGRTLSLGAEFRF